MDSWLGVPLRAQIRLRAIAYIEAAIFFALIVGAATIKPVWLGATVFVSVCSNPDSRGCWYSDISTRRNG